MLGFFFLGYSVHYICYQDWVQEIHMNICCLFSEYVWSFSIVCCLESVFRLSYLSRNRINKDCASIIVAHTLSGYFLHFIRFKKISLYICFLFRKCLLP